MNDPIIQKFHQAHALCSMTGQPVAMDDLAQRLGLPQLDQPPQALIVSLTAFMQHVESVRPLTRRDAQLRELLEAGTRNGKQYAKIEEVHSLNSERWLDALTNTRRWRDALRAGDYAWRAAPVQQPVPLPSFVGSRGRVAADFD
jgi:hypothetical protein